ncbi:MAG: ArnT family glycosyltransferase [Chthoniobacterales bacterium]
MIRWRFRECPLERDEGEYAYIGQLLLRGIAPYGVTGNHKFPGVYLAYAAIMAVFGETTSGIHVGMLVVNLANTLLIFFLGRRLSGNAAGLAAAAAWVLMSVSPGVLGNAGHLTHLVVLAVLGGATLLWRWTETRQSWWLVSAGVCLGIAIGVRQTSLVFVVFAAVFVALLPDPRSGNIAGKVRQLALLLLASAIPLLLLALWLWLAGVFPQFWRWTFTQAAAYGSQVSPSTGLHQFLIETPVVIGWNCLIWGGAAIGLAVAPAQRSRAAWLLIGFLMAGVIAIIPGFYFRGHYYVQVLPAIALLFGMAVQRAWNFPNGWRYAAPVVSAVALVLPLIGKQNYFFESSPTALARLLYGPNPFPESLEIARYLRANSDTGDAVAVLGSEPEIFFYSRRRSATSLIHVYPLMERHRYAHAMQEAMAREIEAEAPKFVVVVNVSTSWLKQPDSDTFILTWARAFLKREYRLDGMVDIVPDQSQSRYVWGASASTYRPESDFFISVYRRIGR